MSARAYIHTNPYARVQYTIHTYYIAYVFAIFPSCLHMCKYVCVYACLPAFVCIQLKTELRFNVKSPMQTGCFHTPCVFTVIQSMNSIYLQSFDRANDFIFLTLNQFFYWIFEFPKSDETKVDWNAEWDRTVAKNIQNNISLNCRHFRQICEKYNPNHQYDIK